MAISADGQTLAVGSWSGVVTLVKTGDGAVLHSFAKYTQPVHTVAFSPDGQLLAMGNSGGTLSLWRVGDGTQLSTSRQQSIINLVAFCPDGQTLAAVHRDLTFRRVNDGMLLRTVKAFEDGAINLMFNPDGETLTSANADGILAHWRLNDGIQLRRLGEGSSKPGSAFSTNDQLYAQGSFNGAITLRRVEDGTLLRTFSDGKIAVSTLAFTPDDQVLIVGYTNGDIVFWRVEDGTVLVKVKQIGRVQYLVISANGQMLATSAGNTITVWNARDGSQLRTITEEGTVFGLTISPDGQTLAASIGNNATLRRVNDGALLHTLTADDNVIDQLTFSPDGKILVTGSMIDIARLWRVDDGACLDRISAGVSAIHAIAFSRDGTHLAFGGDTGISLWKLQ